MKPRTLAEAMKLLAARDAMIERRDAAIEQRDATIAAHEQTIRGLRARLAKQFARSSERIEGLDDQQLTLFQAALDADAAAKAQGAARGEFGGESGGGTTVKEHTRRGNGRVRIPDHLPREHVTHDLSPAERPCPGCSRDRIRIGKEITEVLEYVPATMKAVVHERCTYACPECAGHFVTADGPQLPFDRSKAGPGLLAATAVSKYADHQPLYRQEGIFQRFGVLIPRSTQSDWMRRTAEAIEPLAGRIAELIRMSRIIQTDDTPVRLRAGPKKGVAKARFWSYVGDRHHRYVAYDFSANRRGEHTQKWLRTCRGYLQSDAFAGYDTLTRPGRQLVSVGCWAHARRKFHDARISHSKRATEILDLIRTLYAVEEQARATPEEPEDRTASPPDPARRHTLRNERARVVADAIFDTLRRWKPEEPPKSSLGMAITYALNQEAALRRYLDDGELEIDNNACERSLRGIALGRKNWLFAGSERGGRTAATLFTVIGSARLHEVEPWAYVNDVLDRMPHAPWSDLDSFLPDQWLKAHPTATLALNR